MSKQFPEMDQAHITVDEMTRQRHLDSINSAIRSAAAPRLRRLRFLAVSLALVLLLPVVALASDGSVPGDFLYPVKRAIEPIVGVFDVDVAAEHRVEEVEILLDREVSPEFIHTHVDEAREAVTDHRSQLNDRIDVVVSELERREKVVDYSTAGIGDQGSDELSTSGNDDQLSNDGSQSDSGAVTHRDTTTTTLETTTSTQSRDRVRDG